MTQAEGSVQEWETNWKTLAAAQKQLYVRETPRTMMQFWQRCYFEDLWSAMGDRAESASYIEIGAGRGTTSMYLAGRNCRVTMVDLSETAFRLARENFDRENLRQPEFVIADARSTHLPSNSFDCVFSIGLLEHFEDPRPLLSEAFRLLTPGGLLFMVVVSARSENIKWLARLMLCPWRLIRAFLGAVVRKGLERVPMQSADTLYRTAYSRKDYERWLNEIGAEHVVATPYNPYHSVYCNDRLNRLVALPVYRFHHALKRHFGCQPALRTLRHIAACDLLCASKAVEP